VAAEPLVRTWVPGHPVDLLRTLGPLRRGGGDPTYVVADDGAVWRTLRTPQGIATQRISVNTAEGAVRSESWGEGAEWAAERLPVALGADDDVTGFDASLHPLVAQQWRRYGAALRTPSVGLVFEMLVPAAIEQRVTGLEARRAWRWLLRNYGEPAPGPAPPEMRVFPAPEVWRRVPSWDWHRAGVDGGRSATVLRAAGVAPALERCLTQSGEQARATMRKVQGVGIWTAAEVAQRALGDADAVSYGDFHIAHNVVFALTGETDGTDHRMAELLEPWAGHRGRVVRLLELTGISRPARGPRYSPHDFRSS
jgi:3-methyladenine DNA glycosylase/8-oxoguanine DNA glycosylase